jgi:hypothetical protein
MFWFVVEMTDASFTYMAKSVPPARTDVRNAAQGWRLVAEQRA